MASAGDESIKARIGARPAVAKRAANKPPILCPNNSGGAIPGQGSTQPATLSHGGGGAAKAQASGGASTDIMQGTQGSAGYSQGSGFESMNDQPVGSRAVAAAAGSGYAGMDLKKYLPSLRLRTPAEVAALNRRNAEINGPSVDLFQKFSDRLTEYCKLGLLWDCYP